MIEAFKFEAEKVSMKQLAGGDWHIVLKVDPTELHQSIMLMAPGERIMVASVAVDQNDRPVKAENVVQKSDRQTFENMSEVTQAVLACRRDDFQQWLGVNCEEDAKAEILKEAGLASRSEFKKHPVKWARIWGRFRHDYGRE